jgi:hypothetical protein
MSGQLTILVPYRGRLDHMRAFVPHILQFLERYRLTVLVIEQADVRPFNRGALLNAGFLLAPASEWVAFHDIDMLPVNSSCDYSRPDGVCHLAGCVEQFGYSLPYMNYCGGVLLSTLPAFKAINGFSNRYWGWGCEDDDLFVRLWGANFSIERRPGRYHSLPHGTTLRKSITTLLNQRTFRDVLQRSVVHTSGEKFIEPKVFRRSTSSVYIPKPGAEVLSRFDGLSTVKFNVVDKRSLRSYANFNREIDATHQVIAVELFD